MLWQLPAGDLRPFVTAFVERRDHKPLPASIELPLASPQIQVMLGSPYSVESAGSMEVTPAVSLWGGSTRRRRAAPLGKLHAFVAVLTPAGAARLCRGKPGRLLDRIVDLEALIGRRAGDFGDALATAPSFPDRVALAERFIRDLTTRSPGEEAAVLDVAAAIASHQLIGSVAGIAARYGLHERTLHSRFVGQIGCSPKRLLRIARLQRLLRTLHPNPWGPGIAGDVYLEFFDQAHLIRDFRSLTGLSPVAYSRMKNRIGDALVHGFLEERQPDTPSAAGAR